MSSEDTAKKSFVILATINASIGFAQTGYVTTIFNSIQILLVNYIFPNASTSTHSLIASSPYIGGVTGALCTEFISRKFGRKSTMIVSDIIALIGVILTLFHNIVPLIIGRILTGFTAGVSGVIIPLYITEISKEPLRGPLGAVPVIASSSGVLIAYLLGFFVPGFIEHNIPDLGCKMLLFVPAILSLMRICNLMLFFNFETPFYLVKNQQEEEAIRTLQLLYEREHTQRLQSIVLEQEYMYQEERMKVKDLIKPKYKAVFSMGLVLALGHQFMGVSSILAFSNMILSEGVGDIDDNNLPLILTNIMGVFNVAFSLILVPFMKRYGRRTFIVGGVFVIGLVDLIIATISFADSIGNWFAKVLVVSWTGIFSLSLGTLLYLYLAETLPEIAVGIAICVNWTGAFIATQTFMGLTRTIGYGGVFLIYGIISLLVAIISYFYLIESKEKSKRDILMLYMGKQPEKDILPEEEEETLIG